MKDRFAKITSIIEIKTTFFGEINSFFPNRYTRMQGINNKQENVCIKKLTIIQNTEILYFLFIKRRKAIKQNDNPINHLINCIAKGLSHTTNIGSDI